MFCSLICLSSGDQSYLALQSCRGKDALYRAGLSMNFLHEKNGTWITYQSELHLSLCERSTCLQRHKASILRITLVITDDYEQLNSLILLGCFELHHSGGESSSRIWLEFYGLCICVLSGMCVRSVSTDTCLFVMCDRNLLCYSC